MLSKSILKENMKKLICLLMVIVLLSSLLIIFLEKETNAAYSSSFKNYPGYEELLKELQEAHPNWEFELYDTGLTWQEAVIGESTAHHNLNQVSSSSGSAWKCSCGKGGAGWVCASSAAVAYYMDPRNSLNEDYIFQFEQLTYDPDIQTREGVETILADCDYMQGKITYKDKNGNTKTINKTYIDVIMEAAKQYNVSPYHLASRIRQEQGTTGSAMITGTWTGAGGKYKGYYNYFNYGAFGGGTDAEVIENGLKWAAKEQYNWTDPEKAIKGGAALIASDYIEDGQDTLYFQKFDVIADGGYYAWQYMQNVAASKNEGEEIREAYRDLGLLNKESKIKFKIPVYDDMPTEKAAMPGMETIVTQDVQITENTVRVRSGKGTNHSIITTLNKGAKLLRIELDNKKDSNGRYWDKVVLSDGKKGYVSREYLTQISLQSNSNEKYIVTDYTNFRNGPGTKGNISTTIIKLLSPGQIVTVVEKGKYENVDGEAWYRVKLSDGTYGYVGTGYIEPYDEETSQVEKVKVVCSDGLNIRREPSTSSAVLKAVAQGTILTRTQKDVASSDSKYIWDKVTTSSGVVGYVVREDPDTKKAWIEPLDTDSGNENNNDDKPDDEKPEIQGDGFQSSGTNLLCEPDMTLTNIKKVLTDATLKKGEATVEVSDKVATGNTITTGGKTYTIIVLGDVNGDAKVNTGDTLAMSQHIEKFKSITGTNYLEAADVNRDGKINTGDSLPLRQHVENFKKISL